jgi:VWFA-related protein
MNADARISRTATPLLALLAFSAAVSAQQGQQTQTGTPPAASPAEAFTLRANTHLVVLDVSVLDWKGSPATGLTKDAFRISEDGHDQTIKSLEEHTPIDPAMARERLAAVAAKLPPNTFTNFKPFPSSTVNVIVLDALTSPASYQRHHHELLVDYMKTVPPGTAFIIFKLDTQLHLVQGLTSDPAVLRTAVAIKPGEVVDPPNLFYEQRRQIVGSAVNQLASYLSSLPNRKTMLWFSYALGIALSATGDHNDETETPLLCGWTDVLQQNRIDVYRLGSEPDGVSSGLGCHGGHKPGNTIAALVDGAAHFYTLSYTPTNANWNGHYRKINVTVNGKGTPWKGITADFREGYFGRENDGSVRSSVVSAPSTPTAQSLALQRAMGLGAPAPDDIVFEATVTPGAEIVKDAPGVAAAAGNFLSEPLRTKGYRAYQLHYAVRADQLRLIAAPDQKAYAEKLEVVAVIYDSLGHPLNSKKAAVSASFDGPDDPRLAQATVTADLTTQVPATGDYFLRIGVHDLAADKVGALEIPVSSIKLAPEGAPAAVPGK